MPEGKDKGQFGSLAVFKNNILFYLGGNQLVLDINPRQDILIDTLTVDFRYRCLFHIVLLDLLRGLWIDVVESH